MADEQDKTPDPEHEERSAKEPDPAEEADKARDELAAGLGHMFRAARHAASGLRGTLKSGSHVKDTSAKTIHSARERVSHSVEEAGKALDDAGRELARAANNVAERISEELSHVGLGGSTEEHPSSPSEHPPEEAAQTVADGSDWPKTRLEYDRKYGSVGDDWPRTREEYERRYGEPKPLDPKPDRPDGPTPEDPGFRIATDDD